MSPYGPELTEIALDEAEEEIKRLRTALETIEKMPKALRGASDERVIWQAMRNLATTTLNGTIREPDR